MSAQGWEGARKCVLKRRASAPWVRRWGGGVVCVKGGGRGGRGDEEEVGGEGEGCWVGGGGGRVVGFGETVCARSGGRAGVVMGAGWSVWVMGGCWRGSWVVEVSVKVVGGVRGSGRKVM